MTPLPHSLLTTSHTLPAGLAALVPSLLAGEKDLAALEQLAAEILKDPVLQQKLGDRVFELLKTELMYQHERNWGYGRR